MVNDECKDLGTIIGEIAAEKAIKLDNVENKLCQKTNFRNDFNSVELCSVIKVYFEMNPKKF